MRRRLAAASVTLVVAGALLALAFRPADGGTTVRAEFSNARGLLVGNDVRVGGAPVGSVEAIELTARNTAMVTLELHDGLPPLRRDAVAAIRPVDLLGDIYVALSPGHDAAALRGPIPLAQTSNAPRLSELLSAFRPRARAGLQALLVGLGSGLHQRGVDVNRAAVELRPALEATDRLMDELGSQRASLRALVADAHALTRQPAARRGALAGTVEGLSGTLRAVAARRSQLDQGLAVAPDLLARLRGTAGRLQATAHAGVPFARALRRAAPGLSRASAELAPFLASAQDALGETRPLVRRLGGVLDAGEPTLGRLATGFTALARVSGPLKGLMRVLVPAAPPISEGFFVNFPDQAAEPGTQPFDPFADPARHYWRGAAVFTCEAFGMKVSPGCLDRFMSAKARRASRRRPAAPKARPDVPVLRPPAQVPAIRLPERLLGGGKLPQEALPPAPLPKAVTEAIDKVLRHDGGRRLLDYLLGP